jgi:hypothetical protein
MENAKKIITPLSVERHSGKFWRRYTCYEFAKKIQFAPITVAELSMAVQTLTLCFTRRNDRFYFCALLSLAEGENYFVNSEDKWASMYVPACFRGHPFYAGRVPQSDNFILCVDEACGLISDTEGLAFFGADKQLSPEVAKILDFLKNVENSKIDTQRGVDALAEAGTIVEWPLKVKTNAGEVQLSDLFRFDEAKFTGLDDGALLKLRRTPAIGIGYGQLYSMINVRVLVHLANIRQGQMASENPADVDFEKMLDDNDFIRF